MNARLRVRCKERNRALIMISRRYLLAGAILASACFSVPAFAVETINYTAADFDAAQKAGKSILVEIHAPWCPTCKAQAQVLSTLEAEKKFADLVVIHVDFDTQKDALRRFGARVQSTLICFKGGQETARSIGATDRDSLAALLDKAI